MDAALRALNRYGLGARPGERGRIKDPRGWLHAQLEGGPPLLDTPRAATPTVIGEAIRAFRQAGQANRLQRRQSPATSDQPQQQQQARQQARRRLGDALQAEGVAALERRVGSDRPFVERLVAFWSNHLCVSTAAKVLVVPLAGSYEREVIRPHVLGRFEDMVLASAKHPAMLVYLDNFQSIGPSSRGAQRGRGRGARGLNENYARELLELHTVGVSGGYTQQDVQELARLLTGWTVSGLLGAGPTVAFTYQDGLHEPGSRTVLGVTYAGSGLAQGERAIRDLCGRASTARFVATKLATHFIADEPPASAVDRLTAAFRTSGGDLRVVSQSLIELPEVWSDNSRKFRSPHDWLIATLRAFDSPNVVPRTLPVLRQLRQPLWAPQAPKGFGDSTQEWADPDSLLNRAELARTIARRLMGDRLDPRDLLDVVDIDRADPLRTVLADTSVARADRLALAIAGPSFQWR